VVFLYASTNKVYGGLEGVAVVERETRYEYDVERNGIGEQFPLDLHSPYGCSKGSADQYVRDYHRIFGLQSVVFRQSCIYGTRQFGVEDQGWVAWFTIAALLGLPMTIYGNGKQIRDVLWIDDLIEAYVQAIARIDRTAGQIYNIGGGPTNTLSLVELVAWLRRETGEVIAPERAPWRAGDQRVFVAGIAKAMRDLDWRPRVTPEDGVKRLAAWVHSERALLARLLQTFRPSPVFAAPADLSLALDRSRPERAFEVGE
jgi:CDP-paratose 2-epimerase